MNPFKRKPKGPQRGEERYPGQFEPWKFGQLHLDTSELTSALHCDHTMGPEEIVWEVDGIISVLEINAYETPMGGPIK